MNQKFKRFEMLMGITFFMLLLLPINGISQNFQQTTPSKRTRENFDSSWLFHKGDIAIKRAVKACGYGGLTDVM